MVLRDQRIALQALLTLSILLLPFFLYSLVVLCLDAYVNLTVMSCKTEQSLINHLVLAYLVLS